MSHRPLGTPVLSDGAAKQASNNDLRGLQQRGAITKDEARALRQQLLNGSPAQRQKAYDKVQALVEQWPSHRRGLRSRPSWRY